MAYENTLLRKQLNRISFAGLWGVKVGDALAIDTWHFREWTRETVSNFEFVKIPEYDYRMTGERVDKAFVFSHAHIKRRDWLRKFCSVEKNIDNKIVITAKKGYESNNIYLRLIPLWYFQMRRLPYSSVVKMGICFKLCGAFGQARSILKMLRKMPDMKKIIVFCDIPCTDSLLVQISNRRGYLTYTLQHGIVNGTYDYIEYKCSHARYFLAWGEYTKWMAMKYGMPEDKLKVVGSMEALEESERVDYHVKGKKCFLVCTNGVDEKSAWLRNREIVQMANRCARKYGMKYYLRVHPYDDSGRYRHIMQEDCCYGIIDSTVEMGEILKRVTFTLCGNSTTFCDSLYYGVPAFRYIASKDRKIDVCKGIRTGRIENDGELEACVMALIRDGIRTEEMIKIGELLFHTEGTADRYIQAIERK